MIVSTVVEPTRLKSHKPKLGAATNMDNPIAVNPKTKSGKHEGMALFANALY